MEKKSNSEEFFKIMIDLATEEKIVTPSYAQFIQTLSIIFDINKDSKTRPREMSESRSMSRRQAIHDDVLTDIFSLCQIEDKDLAFLKSCFLKFENILSHLKSISIFSNKSRAYGNVCFFWLIALPQIMLLVQFCRDIRRIKFAHELYHYLKSVAQEDKPEISCIKLLKKEIAELVDDIECPDFKIAVGRMDPRSFPMVQTINDMLTSLGIEVQENLGTEKSKEIVLQATFKLLAAKIVFKIFKMESKNSCHVDFPDMEKLFESHRWLCERYVCHQNIKETHFDFVYFDDFRVILSTYLKSIDHVEFESLPCEVTQNPGNLIRYHNNAFLPIAVLVKFQWDLERKRVNESYIKQFEKAFLLTMKKYQYGLMAGQIAGALLALKIQKIDNIPHQSLEPLTMVLMESSPVDNELSLYCDTPFGKDSPYKWYTSDVNVAKAIYTFNKDVRTENIKLELCNPLEGLDHILQYIFEKIDQDNFFSMEYSLPKYLIQTKPVKGFVIDLYDALKNINELIYKFNLIKSTQDGSYTIRVTSSLAGMAINKYLKLTDHQQIEILKKIDPEQFNTDMAKIQ